jgi:beta-N-acetylhexosaminidase
MERLIKALCFTGLIFVVLFAAPVLPSTSTTSHFWENKTADILIEELMSSMNDEELLGQVFFLGYVGTTPSEEIKQWISARNLGGVKIFTRNVSSLASLASGIRDLQLLTRETRFKIPLLVATDQEGGWVEHIRREASTTGGNLSLGAGGVARDAFLTGYYIGEELKALGINMNFAPDLDVYSISKANAVGPRAFSSDPLATAVLGAAYIQGQKKAGIISTGKHFPGHGGADLDSHGFLPEVGIDANLLWERELVPYRVAVKEGLEAIMTAHIAFPRVTGNREPASLSLFFINDIIRGRLRFEGVVITDDMEMNGVIMNGDSIPEACLKALKAGNDMILVSHTPLIQEKVWKTLIREIKTDDRFRETIKTSLRRILKLKIRAFKGTDPFPLIPNPEGLSARIPAPNAGAFFFSSICRGVTLVRSGSIPYTPAAGEKLVLIGQYTEFLEEGKKRYPLAETLLFSWSPMYQANEEDIERVKTASEGYDVIIFCLANPNSLGILKSLERLNKKIIVVSALTPVYLEQVPWVRSAVAVYGDGAASFQAGFAVLSGDFTPEGRLPVDFSKIDRQEKAAETQRH